MKLKKILDSSKFKDKDLNVQQKEIAYNKSQKAIKYRFDDTDKLRINIGSKGL